MGLVGEWQTRVPGVHAICSKGAPCVSESGGNECKAVLVHAGEAQSTSGSAEGACRRGKGARNACMPYKAPDKQVIQLWGLGRRQIARIAKEERNRRVLSTAMAKLQAVVESQRVTAP